MFRINVIFAESADNAKRMTEKYIRAMYGKTMIEFARELERKERIKKENSPTSKKEENYDN